MEAQVPGATLASILPAMRATNGEQTGQGSSKRSGVKKRLITPARRLQNQAAQRAFRKRQKEERRRRAVETLCRHGNLGKMPIAKAGAGPKVTSKPCAGPPDSELSSSSVVALGFEGKIEISTAADQTGSQRRGPQGSTPDSVTSTYAETHNITTELSRTYELDATNHFSQSNTEIQIQDDVSFFIGNDIGQFQGSDLYGFENSLMDSLDSMQNTLSAEEATKSPPYPFSTTPTMSDPYSNTLQLTWTTTRNACLHNALALRVEISAVLNPDTMSPFYRPFTMPSDPLNIDPTIPVHLQPTLPQILFPHHVCLDLIPIPSLRSRVLMLAAATPGTFDFMEFKRDAYLDEALVFGGHRMGRQPWDERSWQVAPWFLRKWRLLLDEGE